MAWTTRRNILYFFLFMVYSQTGQCCKKRFSQKSFEAVVPPRIFNGEHVLTVEFHDCNLGEHIRLSTNDKNFGIHSNGVIYVIHTQNIDSTYDFKVLAKDLKTHEKWKVKIHLISSANHLKNEVIKGKPPIIHFPKHLKRQKREWIIPPVAVREHEPPMHNPIAVIRSDFEINQNLIYTISGPGADRPPTNMFVMDKRTGELNITGMVDRELNPFFTLMGQAINSNGQNVEKTLSLIIEVLDINDNAPVFTQQVFQGSVEELSPLGTMVLKLNATDRDIGKNAQVAYRIRSQGMNDFFFAKSNGEIRTMTTNLDRETQDLYTLTVEGRDMNGDATGLCSEANAQIRILDVNDNIPTLEKYEYEVAVEENSLNDEVIRIKVFDKDEVSTDNWLGKFDIIKGNENGNFRFEVDEETNEGILILQKELDHEVSAVNNLILAVSNKASYHSSVISGGGGGGAGGVGKQVTIKVNVKDKKEGFSFQPTTKRIMISEDKTKIKIHQTLGRYPAISADTGKESERTRYAKNSDPANFFNIDSKTGEITLANLPDHESEHVVDGKYTATVLAIDNEGPSPRTATGTVVIQVDDENDNIPIIKNLQPCMCDKAKSLTITAFDADSYPNSAPYQFKLDNEPDIQKKWKILRKDDTSIKLQPIKDLWPDTFTVPIKVEDNQGSGKVQNVEVKVIECTGNDLTCSGEKIPLIGSSKTGLGSAAGGLMALGALLLLLVPLLLLFCKFGGAGAGIGDKGRFQEIPNQPLGHLETNNIEGGGETDTNIPLLPVNSTGGVRGSQLITSDVDGSAGGFISIANNAAGSKVNHGTISKGTGHRGYMIETMDHVTNINTMPVNHTAPKYIYGAATTGSMARSSLRGYMGSYIDEKLNLCSTEDQTRSAHDCLLVYNHEGEGSPVGSLGSCSFIEEEQLKDSDLDDLGSKFKTLADICVNKSESEATTIIATCPPVQLNAVTKEMSVSSTSGTLQNMSVMADPALMQKNYVVTTTINPVVEVLPGIADTSFNHQNVVMSQQVHTLPRGINVVPDPSFAHQNVVTSQQVHTLPRGINVVPDPSFAHQNVVTSQHVHTLPRGIQGMAIDPSFAHYNAVMTQQAHSGSRGMQGINMVVDPSVGHQNVVMTKSVNVSSGGVQGMIIDPAFGQLPAVHKNVTLTKSIHPGAGETQIMTADPSFDQIPVIHKNVTLTRSAHSGGGVVQLGSGSAGEALAQKNTATRKSVTSSDEVHRSVTKVTKIAQVMQE
uniref:desmoglein-2-like n=1 Tax=Pristiophorus japonicus TaxID=55135 RepID=UPI00398F468C